MNGTWDQVLVEVHKLADATGDVDWMVSIDSTVARVHQYGATLARTGGLHRLARIFGPSRFITR